MINPSPRPSGVGFFYHGEMPRPTRQLMTVLRWLIAVGLSAVGFWLITKDDSWRLGIALPLDWLGQTGMVAQWLVVGLLLAQGLIRPVNHLAGWAWLMLLLVGVATLFAAGEWGWAMGLIAAQAVAFDPRWLPAHELKGGRTERVFYDGGCGLCHASVKWVVKHDAEGTLFRFAPLNGMTFLEHLTPEQRATLPDSLVVCRDDFRLLTRSDAALHIANRIGGMWRVLAWLGCLVPRSWRDGVYDRIAARRLRLFGPAPSTCPVDVDSKLFKRFDP